MPGAICLSSSSHFAAHAVFELHEAGRVAARPRQTVDEAGADRIGRRSRTRSARCGSPATTAPRRAASGQDDVRCERGQFRRVSANACRRSPAPQRMSICTLRPTVQPNCCSPCEERRDAGLRFRIVRGCVPS